MIQHTLHCSAHKLMVKSAPTPTVDVSETRKTWYTTQHDVKGRENVERTKVENFPLWL